jgi:uncharacterized protein (TIGR02679 family)
VVALIKRLASAGAEVRYHGDFDWAGLRIAQALRNRVAWQPWRFRSQDYRKALRAEQAAERALALAGPTASADWCPELTQEMARTGRAVEEEAVIGELVDDIVRLWGEEPGVSS